MTTEDNNIPDCDAPPAIGGRPCSGDEGAPCRHAVLLPKCTEDSPETVCKAPNACSKKAATSAPGQRINALECLHAATKKKKPTTPIQEETKAKPGYKRQGHIYARGHRGGGGLEHAGNALRRVEDDSGEQRVCAAR